MLGPRLRGDDDDKSIAFFTEAQGLLTFRVFLTKALDISPPKESERRKAMRASVSVPKTDKPKLWILFTQTLIT